MIKQAFGENLRRERRKRGLSQEKLAFEAGIDLRFLQELEAGEKQPTITTLFQIAWGMETTPTQLLKPVWDHWKNSGPAA